MTSPLLAMSSLGMVLPWEYDPLSMRSCRFVFDMFTWCLGQSVGHMVYTASCVVWNAIVWCVALSRRATVFADAFHVCEVARWGMAQCRFELKCERLECVALTCICRALRLRVMYVWGVHVIRSSISCVNRFPP